MKNAGTAAELFWGRKASSWTLAVIITLAAAVYQRLTGPTYPVRGKAAMAGTEFRYRLPRSAENSRDCLISVTVPDARISGTLSFKRVQTDDPWIDIPFERRKDELIAFLPKQPPAGKLAYRAILSSGDEEVSLTGEDPVVIRFKGQVPAIILIPHILVMFLAMLFSARAGLAALDKRSDPRPFVLWTAVLLFIGGFILGVLVQKYAFGVWWSGFPLGTDLTDSKTLIAMFVWTAALIAGGKGRPARGWVLAASIVTLLIFLIPHSLLVPRLISSL